MNEILVVDNLKSSGNEILMNHIINIKIEKPLTRCKTFTKRKKKKRFPLMSSTISMGLMQLLPLLRVLELALGNNRTLT